MIRSFRTERPARSSGASSVENSSIAATGKRKLDQIHAAAAISDLASVPGNRLETLTGDRSGQYSIRVNDQWRICFAWVEPHAIDVEIVDYH